jgi:hypothetical protein
VARLSQKVGPEVGKAGDLVYRAFSAQGDFLGNSFLLKYFHENNICFARLLVA